jgi:hypothetical protein
MENGRPSQGGGLLKLTPADNSCEVLLSSRRTPPVGPLDGKPRNNPADVFEDGKGNVYFWWWNILDRAASPGQRSESQVYKWSKTQNAWEKVFSSGRFLRLKEERPGALLMTRGIPPDGLGMYGFSRFEQIVLLNPESAQFELLLENPEAEQHPLHQSPRWEFPPELCRVLPNANRFHEMAWHDGALWIIAYDQKYGEQRGSEYELFAFLSGQKTAVRIPLRFDVPEPDKQEIAKRIYPYSIDRPLLSPNGFFATGNGLVITVRGTPGFWFLPYSEIPQLSQPAGAR